ncbi:hypothetical protein [Intestinibacillus massiliensis]
MDFEAAAQSGCAVLVYFDGSCAARRGNTAGRRIAAKGETACAYGT